MQSDCILTPDQIPATFCRCFQSDCPKANDCAHYLAGTCLEKGQVTGFAIFPSARKGDQCACFRPIRVVKAAWGFRALFADVKVKDDAPLRRRIKLFLGGNGSYYRYHHGERLLTPNHQKWIIDQFRKRGYTQELEFDGYRYIYDFTIL